MTLELCVGSKPKSSLRQTKRHLKKMLPRALCSILILFVIFLAESETSESNLCSESRCSGNQKFNVDKLSSLTYEYNSEIVTDIRGINNDKAENLSLTAKVHLQLASPCEFNMRIHSVRVKGIQSENSFAAALQQNPIRFHLGGNGVVEGVCPFHESSPVVNIKKGIISLLQSSAVDERRKQTINDMDVLGDCPTDYVQRKGWNSWIVKKEKDLTLCSHHQHLRSSIQLNPLTKGLRSLPLIRGRQSCRQVLSSGFVTEVECNEWHVFRPFSTEDGGGAVTRISQKLTLLKRDDGDPIGPIHFGEIHERSNLLAEHSFRQKISDDRLSVDQILIAVCKETEEGVTARSLTLFEELVGALRAFSVEELLDVVSKSNAVCDTSKKVILDAVSQLDTAASMSAMAKLLMAGSLPRSTTDTWINSLSFQKEVTIDKIEAVFPIFNASVSNSAYLAASVMVHAYCQSHVSCRDDAVIRSIALLLEDQLARDCQRRNDDDEYRVLLALKAIGNVGQFDQIIPKLTKCSTNDLAPVHLRLAAVQAHRRFSCKISREHLIELFVNSKISSELRIAAYLEIMRCPSSAIIQTVEHTLETEQINQVGSFVWTHLTNIRESTDLCKSQMQSLLANVHLRSKFSTDARKFSRAFETSVFSETLDAGMHSEAHVVFPTDSYVPRSMLLNLTVDVFGRSINLVEISGRAIGFEPLIQSIFGPGEAAPTYSQPMKEKSSIDEKKLKDISDKQLRRSGFGREPHALASVKIFGNEVHAWSARGKELLSSFGHKWDLQHFLTGLTNDHQMHFSQTSNLLDTRLIVATGAGLPLTLSLESTAAINFDLAGRVDIRRLFVSRSCYVDGHVRPSVALKMTGTMTVDFADDRAGVQLESTLHSSTSIDGRLEMHAGELARLRINVPREKVEILNVQSKLLVIRGEKKKAIDGVELDRAEYSYCSSKLTTNLLGVQMCGRLAYPNATRVSSSPYFPLTGPAEARIFLEKTDPGLTSYLIEYRWEKDKAVRSSDRQMLHHFLLSFNTPRSNIDRELTAELLLNRADREASFRLLTPFKKIVFSGNYIDQPDHRKLDAILVVDDEKFMVQTDLRSETTETTYRLLPTLHVRSPVKSLLSMTGSLTLLVGSKLNIDMRIDHLIPHPIIFSGFVVKSERHPSRIDWNLQLDASPLFADIEGFYQTDAEATSAACTFGYTWRNGDKQLIEFLTKIRKVSLPNRSLTRIASTTALRLTAFPEYNTLFTWNFLNAQGHVENIVQLGFGENARDEHHQIGLRQIFSFSGTITDKNLSSVLRIVYPVKEIDFGVTVDYNGREDAAATRIIVQMKPDQRIKLSTNFTDQTKTLAKFLGEIILELPSRVVNVRGELIEQIRHEYLMTSTVSWDVDKEMTMVAIYRNKSHRKQLFYTFHANVTVLDRNPWEWNYAFMARENHMHFGTQFILNENVRYVFASNLTRYQRGKYNVHGLIVWVDTDYSLDSNLTLGDEKLLETDVRLGLERQIRSLLATKIYDDLTTVDFELLWDAKRNISQRVALGLEYRRLGPGQSAGYVSLQYPGGDVRVTTAKNEKGSYFYPLPFIYAVKGEVEWNGIRQFAVSVDAKRIIHGYRREERFLISSFTVLSGFERVEGEVYRVQDGVEWQTTMKCLLADWLLAEGMLRTTDILSSQRTDVNLRWRTFFVDWDEVNMSGWCVTSASQFKGQITSEWGGDRRMSTFLEVSDVSQDFTRLFGIFNITTPWPELRLAALGFHYVLSDTILDVRGTCRWHLNPTMAIHLTSKNNRKGEYQTVILVNTPLPDFEEVLLQSYLALNQNVFATNATLKWNDGEKIYVEVHAGKHSSGRTRTIRAGVKLTTPFAALDSIGTQFKYTKERHALSFFHVMYWPLDNVIRLTVDARKNNVVGILGNLTLDTPWEGYGRFGAFLQHQRTSDRLKSTINLFKDEKIINGRVFCSVDRNRTRREIEFETPFQILKQLFVNESSVSKNSSFKRRGEFRYNSGEAEGDCELDAENIFNWRGAVNLRASDRQLRLITFQHYRPGDLRHSSTVNWAPDKSIDLNVELLNDFAISKKIEGGFNISTPFPRYENTNARLLFSTTANNASIFIAGTVVKTNFHLAGWKTKEKNEDSLKVTISTGDHLRVNLNGTCNYEEGAACDGSATGEWNENDRVVFSGNILANPINPSFRFRLQTPTNAFKTLGAAGSYAKIDKNVRFAYDRNEDVFLNLNGTWSDTLAFDGSFWRAKDRWSASGRVDVSSKHKQIALDLTWPEDKEIHFHLIKNGRDLLNASVRLNEIFRSSPLRGELFFKNENQRTHLLTTAQWDRQKIIRFVSNYDRLHDDVLLEINARVGNRRHFGSKFRFVRESEGRYSCSLAFNRDDKEFRADAFLLTLPESIDFSVDVRAPLEEFREVKFNWLSNNDNCQSRLVIADSQVPVFNGTASITNDPSGRLVVQMTADAIFHVMIVREIDRETKIDLKLGGRLHTFGGTLNRDGDKFTGLLPETSSGSDLHQLRVSLTPPDNSYRDIRLITYNQQHEVRLRFNHDGYRSGYVYLDLSSPLLSFGHLSSNATFYTDAYGSRLGTLTMSIPRNIDTKIDANLTFHHFSNWAVAVNGRGPFFVMSSFDARVHYTKLADQLVDVGIDLKTDNPELKRAGMEVRFNKIPDQKLDASVRLHAPFENFDVISADGTIFYDKNLNNIHPLFVFVLPETKFNVSGGIQFVAERVISQMEITTVHGDKIQMGSVIVANPNHASVEATVLSPWSGYEKIQFNGSYRLGKDNYCQLELLAPTGTWKANVVGNWNQFPYRLNIDGQIYTPLSTYRTITLQIRQIVTADSFDAKFLSTWSEDKTVELCVELVSRNTIKSGKIVVNDPFDVVPRIDSFYFYAVDDDSFDARASFVFDDDELLDLKIFTDETDVMGTRRALRLINPIWPFRLSLNTSNPTAETFRLLADFVNDPKAKDVSPYFADLLYRTRTTGKTVALKTVHRHLVSIFNSSYDKTISFYDYRTHVTWSSDERNQKLLGYGLTVINKSQADKTNYEGSLTLSHPIRSVKVDGDFLRTRRFVKSTGALHWDWMRNPASVVAMRLEGGSRHGSMYEGEFGLTYPSFEKEFVMKGNVTGAKGSNTVMSAHLVADYSSNPDQLFAGFVQVRNGSGRDREYVVEAGIKHVASEINLHALAEGNHDGDRTEINCRFSYTGEYGERYVRRIRGRMDKTQNIIQLELDDRGVIGKVADNRTHRSIQLARVSNNRNADLIQLIIDKEFGTADFKFAYSNQSYYEVKGGLRTNTEFVLEAFRDGPKDHDIFASLELPNPYLVTYELTWKTTIVSSFKEYAIRLTRFYVTKIQNEWDRIKDFLDDEIQSKSERVAANVRNFARPILAQIQNDVALLRADLSDAREKMETFYRNNDFYLKDILGLTDGISRELIRVYADVAAKVYSSVDHFWREFEVLTDRFYEVWWSWREALTDALDDLSFTIVPLVGRYLDVAERQIGAWKEQFSKGVATVFRAVKNTIVVSFRQSSQFGESMRSKFASLWNAIRSIGDKVSKMWTEIKNFFSDQWHYVETSFLQSQLYLSVRDSVLEIYSFFDHLWRFEIYRVVKTHLDSVKRTVGDHSLVAFVHRQITWVWDKINWLAQRVIYDSQVQLFKSAVIEIHRKVQWLLDYYGLKDGTWTSIWKLYRSYNSLVQRRGYERGVGFDTRNRVIFAPSEGRVRVDQYLPVPWYALTQLPRFKQLKELRNLALLRSWISGPRTSIWEKYYKYRPHLSPKTWFPPYSAYAIIAGNNHYFTFDGRHYEFSGQCVYLLAHDFVDGNLTLAVNYASKTTPSLIILVDGKEIEVSSKVTINGKKTELPQMIGKTSITRHGCVVSIISSRGTLIRCNLDYRVCSLWTDGWYFGKVGGLFGTYNNEPSDDVDESINDGEGKALDHNFVDQWEVGSDVCKNNFLIATPVAMPDDCVSFFEDEFSFFKYCFDQVDPNPYQRACAGDTHEGLGICVAAAAYVTACNLKDIPLAMPRECVHCSTFDDGMVFEGDNVTVKAGDVSPSSDVVFIIEARKCNQQSINKLPDILRSIEEALIYNNLTGNRYSLVAFGGDDVFDRAHVRTVDNEIFANERVVISSFNNIQLGNGTEDVFGALQFASNLPFRIGVSKTFIVLVCAPCRQTSKEMDYPEVHRMLLEDRIHIHLLMDHEFNIKGGKDFYGIDAFHAFTIKDSRNKNLTGDRELRAQISAPKYICVPLALESNGTVFSNRALTDGRKRTKSFLDVFSRRVAVTASEVIDCLSCDCFADNEGSGKMHCQPCHLPGSWYSDLRSFLYDDSEEWEDLDISKQKTKME